MTAPMTSREELADKIEKAKYKLDHMQDGEPEGLGPTEAAFFDLMDESCAEIIAALRGGAQSLRESELKWCGYCLSWHSKPCGEGCCWSYDSAHSDLMKLHDNTIKAVKDWVEGTPKTALTSADCGVEK